jgi:L-rhamnose isomerase
MNIELMEHLKPVTEEEQRILIGNKQINKEIYTTGNDYCQQQNASVGLEWLDEVKTYEKDVLAKRN